MVIVIVLALFVAFWVYIRWDGKRMRNAPAAPLSRTTMEAGYTPRGASKWQIFLGVGSMGGLLAFMEWNAPSLPPFSGRWAFAKAAFFDAIGGNGILSAYIAITVAFFCAACIAYWGEKRRD